jgi:arylsulfatase A-like enzyme/endonuclease/exonuclease/phosphatase family metal-dependent hydrolase
MVAAIGYCLRKYRIMKKCRRLGGWMFLFASIVSCMFTTVYAAEKPMNVVFILVDDLGFMDVGCNNPNTFYETPHVDRIAARGMRFTHGYAANPVCSPTRFSILTGKYPTRAGATNYFSGKRAGRFLPAELHDRMPLEEVTLAETLRESGYATFFAGKWHLGPTEEFWPEHQGFDVNRGGIERGGPYGGNKYFSPYGNPRLADGPAGEHLPDRLATEAADFIAAHQDQPFFVFLSFYSVHTPLIARDDLRQKYEAKAAAMTFDAALEFAEEEQNLPTDETRRVRMIQRHATYAAMVEAMDQAVGKVLDQLDRLGLAENTAIVFTSDNGGLSTAEGSPTSNHPLRAGKGWLYEGGIREPFLVVWPGVTAPGSVCERPVISTDFYPTLLEITGSAARPEQHRDGVSLAPLLRGDGDLPERTLFWHYPHYANQGGFPAGAVRRGPWKLLERYEDGRVHLYHLAEDPSEQHDLAESQPERVAELRAALHRWYREVDAKFLRATPDGPLPWRPSKTVRLRLMSYNIHHGRGADGEVNLERIAKTIRAQQPDLVALQELDRKTSRVDGQDQLAELARLTEMLGVFGKSMDFDGGEYGLGILSRFEITEHQVFTLPSSPEREQRIALEARIRVPELPPLIFVSTHFDHLRGDHDRMRQAERLIELFSSGPSLAILAGDLNATPDSPAIERLKSHWHMADYFLPARPTVPADQPRDKIDYILLEKQQPWQIQAVEVIDDSISSDHLPLVVEVEWLAE